MSILYVTRLSRKQMIVKHIFLIATNGSCQQITWLAEMKGMLHRRYYRVKNCMTWCQSTMTLYSVFTSVNKSFLVLV